nr:MAG TPA: adenine-specific methyltransferase [Caudoviricetes sp.]
MIYREKLKEPNILLINDDFKNQLDFIRTYKNVIVVTDPPFNIKYHYAGYKDNMDDNEYYEMLANIVKEFPSVIIHYPESLHKLSIKSGIAPLKSVSWVYNSNTAKQHRDIVFYRVKPDFTKVKQEYKNPNDTRIKKRIAEGVKGGRMYDWWNVNQVKNVSKDKTSHPCQMPLEVMKNIIAILPEDALIFDCFMGSGTTAIACKELGYNFIGTEIDKSYYEIAKKRLENNENSNQIAGQMNISDFIEGANNG